MNRVVLFIGILTLLLSSCQTLDYGEKFTFDKFQVYHNADVLQEDAEKLHQYFQEKNMLTDELQSVQLLKKKDRFILKLVKKKNKQKLELPESYRVAMQELALDISKNVFNDVYCEIHIASNTFKTIEIIS